MKISIHLGSCALAFMVLLSAAAVAQSDSVVRGAPESHREAAGDHQELAGEWASKGSYSEAIREYQLVLMSDPNNDGARWHLAEVFARAGDYDRSLVTFEDLLKRVPQDLQARVEMARVLRWSHRNAESESQLLTVLSTDPNHLDALSNLAQTYAMEGDFAKSLSVLERALALSPGNADLFAQEGTVLSWSGRLKEGVKYLNTAVSLNPRSASAYRSLADAYTWRHEDALAAESYRRALDLEPGSIETALDLARAYIRAGKSTQAEETVGQILRAVPDQHQALEVLQEIRRSPGLERERTMDVIGEPAAFLSILAIPTWFFYRRQRSRFWRSNLHRRLYRIAFPLFSTLFIAAYCLRICYETEPAYKVAELTLLVTIAGCTLPLFWERRDLTVTAPGAVLVIGAHPDDIELGAGGSLMRLKEEGRRIYGLVLTQGEVGSSAPIGTRESEARKGAERMGLSDLWVLHFPDTHLREHIAEMRRVIEDKICEFDVRIVITHSPHETHGDHVATFEAVREAARTCSMLCFESISAPKEFIPNYFVDITRYLSGKLSAVESHKTQGNKFYMDVELIKGRAAHRGLQAGVPYAEAFWVYRWVR